MKEVHFMRDYKVEFEKRVNFIKSVLAESGAKGVVYGNSGGKDSADLTPVKEAELKALDGVATLNAAALSNIAPRLRMLTLYAVAAAENRLVAGTGNRSEAYVGYFTNEIQKKIKQLKDDILTLQPKEEPKVERDYAADLARLRVELESYTNFENETVIPDSILEAFIERIFVYKDSFDWYLRINRNSDNTTSKEYESEFEEAVSIIDAPDTIEQSEDKLLVASFVLTI